MDAALAHSRSKTHSHEYVLSVLTRIKLILCVDLLLWMRLRYHYTPESKQQSKQWREVGCSTPKKKSSLKVMVSVFWNAEDILFINYLEKNKTITGKHYSSLLTRLDKKIMKKVPVCKKKITFHYDNAPSPQKCFGNGKIKGSAL
jgi:hypothetical protein